MYRACITLTCNHRLVLHLTNRFHVALRLFRNRLECRQNVVGTIKLYTRSKLSVSLLFLPHFNIFCDLLMVRAWQDGIFLVLDLYNKKNQKECL